MANKASGFKMKGFSGFGEGTGSSPIRNTGETDYSKIDLSGNDNENVDDKGGNWWSDLSSKDKASLIQTGVKTIGTIAASTKKKETKEKDTTMGGFSTMDFKA